MKENPTVQEKSQPREQAKRNSPDSRSLRSSSWACQAPVVAQRQVPTVRTVQKNVEIDQVQQRQVPTVRVPHVLHKDKFVNQRIVTLPSSPHRLETSRKQRKHHMINSLTKCRKSKL